MSLPPTPIAFILLSPCFRVGLVCNRLPGRPVASRGCYVAVDRPTCSCSMFAVALEHRDTGRGWRERGIEKERKRERESECVCVRVRPNSSLLIGCRTLRMHMLLYHHVRGGRMYVCPICIILRACVLFFAFASFPTPAHLPFSFCLSAQTASPPHHTCSVPPTTRALPMNGDGFIIIQSAATFRAEFRSSVQASHIA